ncbi:MAG: UbiH/UbiF/VisC/COQ6 family ubiquinone biosynthesis hydroxylase [Pseudomonadota bacterium]
MDADVIIVGGGLTGPLAALGLARVGLSSLVLDAAPKPRKNAAFTGRAYALALGSIRLLRGLDLWDGLVHEPITGIRASDGRAGEGASPLHLRFEASEIGEPMMGAMVEDRHLRTALIAACEAEPLIEMRFNAPATAQAVNGPNVRVTAAKKNIAGRLLLGCDGRRSQVGARAGITWTRRDYGQTSLVCAVTHERDHCGVAHQFFMPPGPLAILPLTERRSSLVWTETAQDAARLNDLPAAEYLDILRPRFGSFLGEIDLVGERGAWPLTLSLADSLVAARVALLGDAAHGIHPIAGQGLNLGIKDVAALSDVMGEALRRGEDIGAADVLARYQRWRRFDGAAMGLFTDSVNRLFSNDNSLLRIGRDLGMGAINAIAPIRRRIIREAAGLTGDLPSLMQT